MESLSQLQKQLRETSETLLRISEKLDDYGKNSGGNSVVADDIDFEKLKFLGGNNAFKCHSLCKTATKSSYLILLLSVILTEKAKYDEWSFLYRVAAGGKYEDDIHELLPDAMTLTEKRITDIISEIELANLKSAFVLDSMAIYILNGEHSGKMLEYLADLYALMNIPSETVEEAAMLVKIILEKDAKTYFEKVPSLKYVKPIDTLCYIYDIKDNLCDDINAAKNIQAEHLIVFAAKATNLQAIDLDEWNAKEIEFIFVEFENIFGIVCKNKHISFKFCKFFGNHTNNANAFLCISSCSFIKTQFEQFSGDVPIIDADKETYIGQCIFKDCTANFKNYNPQCCSLITVKNGVVKKTEFLNCRASMKIRDDDIKTMRVTFIDLNAVELCDCIFSSCSYYASNVYGWQTYCVYMVRGQQGSNIHNCHFHGCYCNSTGYTSNSSQYSYIVALDNSYETNNEFDKCVSPRYVKERHQGDNFYVGNI